MGGRGATSFSNNKYAGRFARGTDEQLNQATVNLNNYINREKNILNNEKRYYKTLEKSRADEFLNEHRAILKELKLQEKELNKEKRKRNKVKVK